MIVYGIVVGLTAFVYFLFSAMHYQKSKVDRITVTFFFCCYLFLLCFRDIYVGVDTKGYIQTFEYVRTLDLKRQLSVGTDEIGFKFLRSLIAFLGGVRLYIIVIAVLSVLPILYLYKNEAEGAMICISFFLISLIFEMLFSGMRQSIAIGLSVPTYYFTKKRKKILFLITVAVAFSFHKSAIMLLLIYPVYHTHITRKWLWIIIPLIMFTYIHRDLILEYAFRLAGDEYVNKYSFLTGTSGQIGLMILFILLTIYSYVFLDEQQASETEIGLRNLLLLAAFIHLFTPLHPVISRINYYFIIFIPVTISRINNRCNQRLYQIRTIACFVMPAFFVAYFFFAKDDSLNVMNYMFCF